MPIIHRALIWAAVIMAVALASITDLIPQALANTLITTLPLLMVVTIARKPCALTRREA